MKRRAFVKGSALTGVASVTAMATAFPTPALSQDIRELKMVTTWPIRSPGLGTAAEDLALRIQAMSEGKIRIAVFAAGEMVPAMETFDAVSNGTADISHSASYYWQDKSTAFNFFAAVPFGLTGTEHAAWIYSGGGQELWDELAAPYNIKPFLRGSTGVRMGGWYRGEVNSLEDMKGLKIRMPGLGGEVLRRIGADAVSLPGGEIFPALQSGAIDAAAWIGPWSDLAFGFFKLAKNYYWPGFHEPGTSGEVLFNKSVWESFPPDQKAILQAAIQAQAWKEFADFNVQNAKALEVLVNEHDVKLRKFPDALMVEVGRISGQVVAEAGAADEISQRVYDSFIEFRKKSISWSRIADQAYWNARSLPFKYS